MNKQIEMIEPSGGGNSDVPVSVILPTFNRARFLPDAIESILDQTFRDFEFIIIDDGSTDDTEQVVARYRDPRILYVKNGDNKGVSASANRGILLARAALIARMDSDDKARPDRLMKQLAFMRNHPDIGVLGGQMIQYRGKQKYKIQVPCDPEVCKATLLFHSCILQPTVMVRKNVMTDNGALYNEKYRSVEDYDLWTRLVSITRIANLPDVVVEYASHSGQLSANWSNTTDARMMKPTMRMLDLLGLADEQRARLLFDAGILHRKLELDELDCIAELFREVEATNRRWRVFQPTALRDVIADVWLRVCLCSTAYGHCVYKKFTRSEWSRSAFPLAKAKLFFLCAVRRDLYR